MTAAVSRLRPWVIAPGWAVIAAILLLYPCFPRWFDRFQFVPFLVGLVLLGLPHGAMDHLVIPHLERRPITPLYLAAFVAAYLSLVLLYLALWHVLPLGALGLFLLMSWLHWGQGDGYFLDVFAGRSAPHSAAGVPLIWAVRGALPIILPPLQFPSYFENFAQGILRWYTPGDHLWRITPQGRVIGIGLVVVLIVCYLMMAWGDSRKTGRKAFWLDALEIALLFVFFSRVPPILAVGSYFCVWHSWRHIARLMLADPVSKALIDTGGIGRAVLRAARQSLPMTLGAILLLGALDFTRDHRAASAGEGVYLSLSLIAALTFPHFLLVLWMDRRQDVWAEKQLFSPPTASGTAP